MIYRSNAIPTPLLRESVSTVVLVAGDINLSFDAFHSWLGASLWIVVVVVRQVRLELLRIYILGRCTVIAKISTSCICLRHLWMYIFRSVPPSGNREAIRDWWRWFFSRCTEVLLDIDGLLRLVESEILRPANRIWRLDIWKTIPEQPSINGDRQGCPESSELYLATVRLCRHLELAFCTSFLIECISGSYVL